MIPAVSDRARILHRARMGPCLWAAMIAAVAGSARAGAATPVVSIVQTFASAAAADQDDMGLWVHPQDPALSLVLGSDKAAGKVFVYDLGGNVLQTLHTGQPGNIDVRYGVRLAGACVDIVAFNERSEGRIRVYRVDPRLRALVRVDDGAIVTGSNYGFTLYKHVDGRLFAITGPSSGLLQQYLLFESAAGQMSGAATGWRFQQSTVEGMVGDDATGYVYLGEEAVGIWKVNALDDRDRSLIAQVGDASGLQADVEGITIYHAALGQGYILASSQGASRFTVFARRPPHLPLGNFQLAGVGRTDGIDVLNLSLNGAFSAGIFLAHNGLRPDSIVAARWQDIVAVMPRLHVDTASWDPRACHDPASIHGRQALPPVPAVLHANSPNPVSTATHVRFTLQRGMHVRLAILDLRGRRLATLVDGLRGAGHHEAEWRATDARGRALPNGVYLCRLEAEGIEAAIKLIVTK